MSPLTGIPNGGAVLHLEIEGRPYAIIGHMLAVFVLAVQGEHRHILASGQSCGIKRQMIHLFLARCQAAKAGRKGHAHADIIFKTDTKPEMQLVNVLIGFHRQPQLYGFAGFIDGGILIR